MRMSRVFITRPIFAAVIAILITVMGGIAYFGLPVSQYPDIVPPTVTVNASYPGASAETVASTVAAPIEQEINGVDDMLYMSSQSTGDGNLTITVTFAQGTDLNAAQVLVQNRVAIATPRLPQEVQRLGVVTRKTSPDFLMVVNLVSPGNVLDRGYMSNYALSQVRDRIARLDGVGDVRLFGARDYAMRVWIDPERAAALNLTAGEIVAALRAQNVQVAAGTLGQPPYTSGNAFQLNIETQGRLTDAEQFAGSSSAPPTMPTTPICRASLPSGSACFSAPAPTRWRPRKPSKRRWRRPPSPSRRASNTRLSTIRPSSSRSRSMRCS
jgi:multidrug efflux pump subunit AcrB